MVGKVFLDSKNDESSGVGENLKNGLNFLHKEVREMNSFSRTASLLSLLTIKSRNLTRSEKLVMK